VLPAAEATLAQNSDSGVKGDHLTQEKAVTLVGKTKPGSAAVVVFTGQEYPVVVGKDGAWQVTLPAVTEDKVYDYQVRVTDNAGNVGVFHGQFTVDTQVDALSVRLDVASDSGMIGDNVTNDMRPHFSGKAEANSAIVLIIGGQKLTTTADENGDWTAVS
ncbi:Ig-like domain-containing protein, partial [Providencia sp. Je.9.19]|uniref:Ig-like domain-containing protein n=1 Tax=Providencia sp. Je.9.19 TaxID=3142844 RepID=UPI003DA8CC85